MKVPILNLIMIAIIAVWGTGGMFNDLSGQEKRNQKPKTAPNYSKGKQKNIPFVDRDGDGINDNLQNGWGLKFNNRYKQSTNGYDTSGMGWTTYFNQLGIDGLTEGPKVDKIIDINNDGHADLSLLDYLFKQFHLADKNNDGIPDKLTAGQFEALKKQIENNIFPYILIEKRIDFLTQNLDLNSAQRMRISALYEKAGENVIMAQFDQGNLTTYSKTLENIFTDLELQLIKQLSEKQKYLYEKFQKER